MPLWIAQDKDKETCIFEAKPSGNKREKCFDPNYYTSKLGWVKIPDTDAKNLNISWEDSPKKIKEIILEN